MQTNYKMSTRGREKGRAACHAGPVARSHKRWTERAGKLERRCDGFCNTVWIFATACLQRRAASQSKCSDSSVPKYANINMQACFLVLFHQEFFCSTDKQAFTMVHLLLFKGGENTFSYHVHMKAFPAAKLEKWSVLSGARSLHITDEDITCLRWRGEVNSNHLSQLSKQLMTVHANSSHLSAKALTS